MKYKHEITITRPQYLSLLKRYPGYVPDYAGECIGRSEGAKFIRTNDDKKYSELVTKLQNCGFKVDNQE